MKFLGTESPSTECIRKHYLELTVGNNTDSGLVCKHESCASQIGIRYGSGARETSQARFRHEFAHSLKEIMVNIHK